MDSPQNQPQASLGETSEEQISLKAVFFTGLRKWKWIVASVVICLGLACLYLARTPKSYTATAAVEIKNEDTGTSPMLSAFSDMGIGSPNANLYNESAYFQSPDLMESVVEALGLDVSYSMKKGLKRISPYGDELPLKVSFFNTPEGDSGSFKLEVNDEGLATISDFRKLNEKLPYKSKPFRFGDRVKTPLGTIAVEPGPAYEKGESYKMTVSKSTVTAAATAWAKQLKVGVQSKEGTVLDISITNQSRARAKDILVALIKAYNDNWILDKNQVAITTSGFINERLGMLEQELGNVDSDISNYKSTNMVPDVAATAAMYLTENQDINKKVLEINNQLQMARYLKDHLMSDISYSRTLPVNLGINNSGIERLTGTYNDLVLQRNSLITNSGESNPLIQDLDARLKNLRASLASSLDNEIHALSTDMRNVQAHQGTVNNHIAANPTQAKYLLSVERQQKVKESLYLYLLQKREENELNQAFTAYNTRVIARPAVPAEPTAPRSALILGVAFLFGLIFPFGLIYLQASNYTKVRGREDLENLNVPFLGEIPVYRPKRRESKDGCLVVKPNERDAINESFRIIRTNLNFMSEKDRNIVMVTSFNPSSGKTFATVNLAASVAIKGVRTLVIDGDLRRGSASEIVGSPKKGLAQYLSGKETDIMSLIKASPELPDLYVLPAGTVPPNPTELLENGRFVEVMETLRKEFSYIFIDCPPINVIADARIIAEVADRCIFVVRAGLFERSMLPDIQKMYDDKHYKNLSIILNGVISGGGTTGYYYGSEYGQTSSERK